MRENINIGIVGGGYVGNATKLFGCKDSNDVQDVVVRVYDTDPEKCVPKDISIIDLEEYDIIFVCVPTPLNEDGSCHLDIVKSVINDLSQIVDKSHVHKVNSSSWNKQIFGCKLYARVFDRS